MGTADNIFVLHGLIKHFVNEGKKLYTAFIDFTKAFDFIVRDILWLKLIKFGVRGKILDIIKSMYQSIKSKVKFNKNISSEFPCHLGVRQGKCLSPFLFSIFLNDTEDEFIKHKCELIDIGTLKLFLLLYADDIVIFSESCDGLQKAFNTLYEYSQHWKLTVNINKTKIMILELFDKLIKPILHYGSEIWGFLNANVIERVHLRFCKNLLGVKRSTQNDFVYGELGRTSLTYSRLVQIIKYWFKILTCDKTKYIKGIYDMMIEDMNRRPNKQNWASSVQHLLESLGFNNVCMFQGVGDIQHFMSVFKQRLSDHFLQEMGCKNRIIY